MVLEAPIGELPTEALRVRNPKLDFSGAGPHWCKKYPEVGQALNVDSLSLFYLEAFLNSTMRRAQQKLGPQHPLNPDMDWFCRQEGMHCAEHRRFNDSLRLAGYAALPRIEKLLKDHFETLLRERSLKFNCAYALGFESSGPIATAMWFEALGDIWEGANPSVVALWRWHLAEEYEHRNVPFDVYRALYGGYAYRLYGLFSFVRDWKRLSTTCLDYLLEEDRRAMSPAEIAASQERLASFRKRQSRFSIPRFMRLLSPLYNPRNLKAPKGVTELLESGADG